MTTVTDPICGMTIDPATAAGSSTFNGETYHFCSHECERTFDAAPALHAAPPAPAESCCAPAETIACCSTREVCC